MVCAHGVYVLGVCATCVHLCVRVHVWYAATPKRENAPVNHRVPSSQLWGSTIGFPSLPLDIFQDSSGKGDRSSSQALSLTNSDTWHIVGSNKCTCWMVSWMNETGKLLIEKNTVNILGWHHILFLTYVLTMCLCRVILFPNWRELNELYTENLDTVRSHSY